MYGAVVTDGQGTFHAVVRQDTIPQVAVYRRSVDGGETWNVLGRFNGDGGGATRPSIAVDGDRVAITFIGLWCEPGLSYCRESPYVVTSTNAGGTWAAPLRLDTEAWNVRVAVDDNRTWIAWDRPGRIQLRGTTNGGASMFVSTSYPGSAAALDAADETMVLAFRGSASVPGADPPLGAVTAEGESLGALQTITQARFGYPSVATADGRSHILLVDQPLDPVADPPFVWVRSADRNGPFNHDIKIMPAGQSATIAAAVGSVAVAVSDRSGIAWVSTSSDRGVSFSSAIAVSSSGGATPVHDSQIDMSFATPPQGRPLARFDWSVPDRYVDTDGSGLPDPANGSFDDATDQFRVYANQAMTVTLDACNKSRPSAGRTIANYTWTIDGAPGDSGATACKTSIAVDDGNTAAVRLDIEDDVGTVSTTEQDVTPQDHLIVSIGDSVASGEGSPHTTGGGAAGWQNGSCHRSALAGPALAAQRLEAADPRSSVTFVQLSCSGAAIVDVPEVTGVDDRATGGLLDAYEGVVPSTTSLRPSQLDQMSALVGNRTVDALLVSIGANDVKFSEVVKGCLTPTSCVNSPIRYTFDARMQTLPGRYRQLATAIAASGIPAGSVHLTEYFDPTSDDLGVTQMRCAVLPIGGTDLLEDDEAIWARDGVIGALNAAGRQAALDAGWSYVGGIAGQFFRHGYCANDHWVVQLGESVRDQGDPNGAFHPNRAGQRVYGAALYADLQSTLLIPAPTNAPGATGGPTALGDLMVITTTYETVTSVAVNMTGGVPIAGAARRLDRLALGDGLLFPAGPPAVDGAAAVAVWTELSGVGSFDYTTRAAQIAVRPNAAVRKVSIVQAPADASLLVADRETVVQATIDAMIAGPESLDVTTTVTAFGSGGPRELVPPTTDRVTLKQGRNVVLLPVTSTFTASEGETVTATVEVSDPIGASARDDVDNIASLTVAEAPEAVTTRSLDVLVGSAGVGGSTVSCQVAKGAAERMAAYANVAMPLDTAGVQANLFCGMKPALTQDEPGVLAGLALLDEIARRTAVDAVVVVVPDGWLQAAAGGAVGVAADGLRGVILEANAPEETLSHELAHVFGLGHTNGLVPAFGARVDKRLDRAGSDWMAQRLQTKAWTGGATWDRLAATIGGPANAPQPLDVNGTDIWVRGTVRQLPDGSWVVSDGQWLRSPTGNNTDPIVPGELDQSRMSLDQLDSNGDTVQSDTVGLGEADPLYGAGATPAAKPFGFGFSTLVPIDPAAVSFALSLDGTVVATRLLSAPPTVVLTSPAAGSNIPRGSPVTVSWTAADLDGDPLTATLLISDDDGVSWRPLATGVTATTITEPVPLDVGGTTVRVKVVVSDGLQAGEAVSDAFAAEPDTALGEERVVFIRDLTSPTRSQPRVSTMRPDGTGVVELGLPRESVYPDFAGGQTLCELGVRICDATYSDPVWGPDDRIYFSSDLLLEQFEGPDSFTWESGRRIWSSRPDGSDLRRITSPASDKTYWPVNASDQSLGNVDSVCPTISPDGNHLAWLGVRSNGENVTHIWIADRVGDGWSRPRALVTTGPQPLLTLHPSFPALTGPANLGLYPDDELNESSCPQWSDDSTKLALIGQVSGFLYISPTPPNPRTGFDDTGVVVVDVSGSMQVVSALPGYIAATGGYVGALRQTDFYTMVNWSGEQLLVSRGFVRLATYNTASGLIPSPEEWGVFELDPANGALVRLTPPPDVWLDVRPNKFKVSPSGVPYGTLYRPFTSQCPYGSSDLVTFQLGSDIVNQIPADRPPGAACTVQDRSFDWVIRPRSGGPPNSPPLLTVDVAAAPDDDNAPVVVDVTEITEPDPTPAAGADDIASRTPPVAAPLDVDIPGEVATTLTLRTTDGTPAAFEISPPSEALTFETSLPDGFGVVTGIDGEIIVTPAPGFRGSTSFSFFVVGDPSNAATVSVTVTGNEPPIAADDDLVVPVGADTVFEASALLRNDIDPDAPIASVLRTADVSPPTLEIVGVFASGNGNAFLDNAGAVHVNAAQAGSYTFSYIVADASGAIDQATVRVTALAAIDATTTTTTDPATTSPTTTQSTATTAPPAANPTPVLPVGPPQSQAPVTSPGSSGGPLPATGGDVGSIVVWGMILTIAGTITLRLRRAPLADLPSEP